MQLEELIAQPQHLPAIPALVQNLIDSFSREDVSLGAIARLIAADPGLAAKLLRLANSAYFRSARRIGTVDDALTFLGVRTARNLVIGCELTAACRTVPGLDIQQFWRYSMSTACIARWLAGPARQDGELGFMVGLLHGIGQFAMRAGMPGKMQRVDTGVHPLDARRAQAEREAFGFDHAEVGGRLARLWRFPESIADGVAWTPRPLAARPQSPVAAVVHLAAWRARSEFLGGTSDELRESYPSAVGASLGIGTTWLPAQAGSGRAEEVMPEVAELTAGLEALIGEPPAPPTCEQGRPFRQTLSPAGTSPRG